MPEGVTKISVAPGVVLDLNVTQSLLATEEYFLQNLSGQPIYYTEQLATAAEPSPQTSPRIMVPPIGDGENGKSETLVVAADTKFYLWCSHINAEVSLIRSG